MKTPYITIFFFLAVSILTSGNLNAQSIAGDSLRTYLNKLVASSVADDKKILYSKLEGLSASGIEKDLDIAIDYYQFLKAKKVADSLIAVEVKKFPEGNRVRIKTVMEQLYPQKTAVAKEKVYTEWLKKFPPSKFADDTMIYDYVVSHIATSYAKEKNVVKAIEYSKKLQQDFWKGSCFGSIGTAFYSTGDLNHAAIFYKKAVENNQPYYDAKLTDGKSKFAASNYPILAFQYAKTLFEQKKFKEALKYAEITSKDPKTEWRASLLHAKIFMALDRNEDAFAKLEQIVKSGRANEEQIGEFKKLYIKLKGSDAGFESYAAEIRKGIVSNLRLKLTKEMVKKAASDFTLIDLDGKNVTLSNLKGKVVILDFWATWCAPCKASFPAMQMAVNKYKEDPNVKFLFIHTWEKTDTPKKDADDYIKSQKYDFQVLIDDKDPESKINKVVSAYKVTGIPSKFIIDPAGNIRFNVMGFEGSNEAAVDEISMMIDMAKKD